ncbi:MAG TPA: DoxX family protein [Thermoanaerobaculia bacterium]|nr:DoxX family protein [Thermoanaerobaculia bacterium]
MERFIGKLAPAFFALLRIVAGVMFAMHGTQKLLGWPGSKPPATAALSIAAGVIEVGAGLLIAIGLFASWAAFLASGTMATAYFLRHAEDGIFPIVNRGELAVLYGFLFLFIAAHGAGAWSIDQRMRERAAL